MNLPRPCPVSCGGTRDHRAFTLIELLVVITIIAVLAGLLLPVVSKVAENARKVEAKSAETQIVSAVKSFQTDYGVYPAPVGAVPNPPTDLAYPPSSSNAAFFYILRGTESANNVPSASVVNTRGTVYFEGNDAKSTSLPKSGFVPSTAQGAKGNPKVTGSTLSVGDFVDPWGNRYGILMDTDYNNVVENPYVEGTSGTTYTKDTATSTDSTQVLRFGVVIWSPGADGVFSTTAAPIDDVISWQ